MEEFKPVELTGKPCEDCGSAQHPISDIHGTACHQSLVEQRKLLLKERDDLLRTLKHESPFPCGCDESDLNQPVHYCADCRDDVRWAYGIGSIHFGVCHCGLRLWRWEGRERRLHMLHITDGLLRQFIWTLAVPSEERPSA